jgi:hypothetical protein
MVIFLTAIWVDSTIHKGQEEGSERLWFEDGSVRANCHQERQEIRFNQIM